MGAPARGTSNDESCPICKGEMEDRRHVAVECFYDVSEVAPTATKQLILQEVDNDAAYWGTTRRYPAGTRDRHISSDGGVSEHGLKVVKVEVVQDPTPPVRLLEQDLFSVDCCKACRADFLRMFGRWAKGEFVSERNQDKDIPIRVLGSTRYVTLAEFDELRRSFRKDEERK